MPEFKIKCEYSRKEKRKFFPNEKEKNYHRFLVKNSEVIPDQYCRKGKFGKNIICWIWMPDKLLKELNINSYFEKREQNYQFILKLGEEKSAKFLTKNPQNDNMPWHNNLILKTPEYFENTVQKIGFWDSENYFYDSKIKPEKPIRKSQNNPTQPKNKSEWGKIILFCLPIVILALFSFLIVKWVSKKNSNHQLKTGKSKK